MSPERREFLNLRTFPARLTADETAYRLGCQLHDIQILVAKGFLRPLGKPRRNITRVFAETAVQRLAGDEKLLSRATEAIQNYWRQANQRFSGRKPNEADNFPERSAA